MDRIVDISTDNVHLSAHRGFLVVTMKGDDLGRVPLDDIAALIANAHGLSYTNNLLVALADIGGLWPLDKVTQALADLAEAGLSLSVVHLLRAAHSALSSSENPPASSSAASSASSASSSTRASPAGSCSRWRSSPRPTRSWQAWGS
jgi:hypothetical protein